MPALKSSVATRSRSRDSQQRSWGTRYDTLLNAAEPSQGLTSPTASAVSSPMSPSRELARDPCSVLGRGEITANNMLGSTQPELKRDWADDEVPHILATPNGSFAIASSQARSDSSDTMAGGTASDSTRKEGTKLPHSASVFVGSLPSDVDETELTQQLRERLEQFARILNVKIIRDAKGGVCAFVQCEDAAQASRIVTRTQQVPQIFMGRQLRFELARAFRSLWISYRKPMQFVPSTADGNGDNAEDNDSDENGTRGRWKETSLPDTMRIWRPRGARYPVVSYQADARRASAYSRPTAEQSAGGDSFDFGGVLFTNLNFDEETIRKIAEAFGPLESFKSYVCDSDSQLNSGDYPPGHNSTRSDVMDPGVWEVKWEHRDDCITALSTLRWVPHLAVTWASLQQIAYPRTPRQAMSRHGHFQSPSPASPYFSQPLTAKNSPVPHPRPFLLLDRMSSSRDTSESPVSPTSARSPIYIGSPNILPLSPSIGRRGNDVMRRSRVVSGKTSDTGDSEDGWMVVRHQNITQTILASVAGGPPSSSPLVEISARSGQSTDSVDKGKTELRSPKWSEGDFPPLRSPADESLETSIGDTNIEAHNNTAVSESDESSGDVVKDPSHVTPSNQSAPRPIFAHRRSFSNPIDAFSPNPLNTNVTPKLQTSDIPPTPELSGTSLNETPTSAMPQTPIYPPLFGFGGAQYRTAGGIEIGNAPELSGNAYREQEKEFDPKSIFVGGLEPYGPVPWDENRLRAVFKKYGEIEHVRIVVQPGKKTAFAFVTFSDESAPVKAIREEHDRNYDGRLIRVQLRELNPTRGSSRFRGRGLGRVHRHAFGQHGDARPHRLYYGDIDFGASKGAHGVPNPSQHVRSTGNDRSGMPFIPDMSIAYPNFVPSSSQGTDSTLFSSTNSFELIPEVESQDSDAKTAVSVTPPPTVLSSSASNINVVNPAAPQSMPPAVLGYIPHPWAATYGAPMPYQIPIPTAVPVAVSQSGPVGNVNSLSVQGTQAMQWNPMFKPPFPYPSYAYLPVIAPEPPSHNSVSGQPSTPAKGQPPLHATGFIQGEHGTLIPVYQPEALNEYMSGSSPRAPNQVQGSVPMQMQGIQAQGALGASNAAMPAWPGYPTHPQFYAYAMPPPVGIVPSTSASSGTQHQIQQGMHGPSVQAAQPVPWTMPPQSPNSHLARRPSHMTHAQASQVAANNQNHGAVHNYQNTTHINSLGGSHHMPSSGAPFHHNNKSHQRYEQIGFRQGRDASDFATRSRDSGWPLNIRSDTQQSNVGMSLMHAHKQGLPQFQ